MIECPLHCPYVNQCMNDKIMYRNYNNVDFEFAALNYFASQSKLLWERNKKKGIRRYGPLIAFGLFLNIDLSLLLRVSPSLRRSSCLLLNFLSQCPELLRNQPIDIRSCLLECVKHAQKIIPWFTKRKKRYGKFSQIQMLNLK